MLIARATLEAIRAGDVTQASRSASAAHVEGAVCA